MRVKHIMIIAAIPFILFACKKDKGPIVIKNTSERIISFSNDIQPIFDASCNGPGCHDLFEDAGKLNLEANVSYSELVNQESFAFAPEMLVKPGDPAASVLLQKMNGNSAYDPQMPLFAPAVADSLIQNISTWIEQGALDN